MNLWSPEEAFPILSVGMSHHPNQSKAKLVVAACTLQNIIIIENQRQDKLHELFEKDIEAQITMWRSWVQTGIQYQNAQRVQCREGKILWNNYHKVLNLNTLS